MKKNQFILLLPSLVFFACQPKPNLNELVKNLVVTTDYDKSNGFLQNSYSTYTLQVDTIKYFNYSSNYYPADTLQCVACTGNNKYFDNYPTTITSEIKNKLDAAGFTKVGAKQNPDLKVYVFIIENYSVSQSYNYNPYGYGYGYGYGSGYTSISVSDQANLYIQLFDLKHFYKSKPNLVWSCNIGDLVSSPTLTSLTTKAIDQAFAQSGYIKK